MRRCLFCVNWLRRFVPVEAELNASRRPTLDPSFVGSWVGEMGAPPSIHLLDRGWEQSRHESSLSEISPSLPAVALSTVIQPRPVRLLRSDSDGNCSTTSPLVHNTIRVVPDSGAYNEVSRFSSYRPHVEVVVTLLPEMKIVRTAFERTRYLLLHHLQCERQRFVLRFADDQMDCSGMRT